MDGKGPRESVLEKARAISVKVSTEPGDRQPRQFEIAARRRERLRSPCEIRVSRQRDVEYAWRASGRVTRTISAKHTATATPATTLRSGESATAIAGASVRM